ncbi:DNA circularization N-terminal domain-containing protein [Cupriavidus sp. D39]|uniref:DNA circularization N-terminal domain-containing protein n=1 Tax=Cupriavidus sp. D39 TaxID=2997877 RepID=UPI0022716E7B|nr:DNA circularization N-terminal domain-containing protein [Cupriavidus sp. D39]MCY0854343.1 DNA circularization N-terminal domain-containing protein [Cupriavidus sp. D39]
MSIASRVGSAVGSIGGVAAAAGKLASLFNGGGDYWSQLRQASYNGVKFGVLSDSGTFGRRSVVHEYPSKETRPWVEDLGLQTTVLRINGFLIENSLAYDSSGYGRSVVAQRNKLIEVVQGGLSGMTAKQGLGTLVHPTLGTLKANCMELEFGASWDRGRVIEVRLVFVLGGDRLYPQTKKPTSDAVKTAAAGLYTPTFLGFLKALASAVVAGAAAIQAAVSTAVGWYQAINTLIHDVKRFWNSISTLAGNFGRLFGGGNSGYAASASKKATSATVSSLIVADTVNRAAVATAGATLESAASNVLADPATFATAAQGVVSALAGSAASPADAIRLLSSLMTYSPTPITGLLKSLWHRPRCRLHAAIYCAAP